MRRSCGPVVRQTSGVITQWHAGSRKSAHDGCMTPDGDLNWSKTLAGCRLSPTVVTLETAVENP